mmetsp:Transcript_13536/g.27784  ORF Transcript_13536/g.27784 Transcript_13536/m.27784 type:complete len:212 (+) Transcript_13536:3-638(+)
MLRKPQIAVALMLALQICVGADSLQEAVLELSTSNADALLASGTWMVEFYAPWCGFCQRFAPTYAEAAVELSSQGVKVAKIDGTKNQALSARFGVQGFPTVFHVHDGEVRTFEEERSKESLVSFATTGWKDHQPAFSSFMSPLGIPKRALGLLVDIALALQGWYDHLREAYGLSQPIAIGISLLATILTGVTLGFIISLFFPHPAARQKRD